MAWNNRPSILGTGDTKEHVEREADVCFTAAFIGMTLFQSNKRGGLTWRVDMEWNTDVDKNRDARTVDDRASMKVLNDVCSKVNHIVRTQRGNDGGGVSWGLTPVFDRGGMICAGEGAKIEYDKVDPTFAKTLYTYLSAPQHASGDDQRAQEMYVGRGAYCGLVLDNDGYAISAMSTIRTTINEQSPSVGDRWRPAANAPVRTAQYGADAGNATWGIIGSVALQETLKQQGMRFFPQDAKGTPVPLNKDADIVGYTHGMIRSIYETARIGQGTAYEMSIGTDTFKLASCLSCSSFMMANDVDASSSHIGRGESWVPYFSGESHNPSYLPDQLHGGIQEAINICNSKYATFMHQCMTDGVTAMTMSPDWVENNHRAALDALRARLAGSTATNTVARNLYLDAMTFHKSDAKRLNDALTYGNNPRRFCNGHYDWFMNRTTSNETKGTWETWINPLTDGQVQALHTAPAPLVKTYTIKASSPFTGDSLALDYALLNAEGKPALAGKLDKDGNATFTVAATGDIGKWKIKIGSDRGFSPVKLNTKTAVGSGDRYSYMISEA